MQMTAFDTQSDKINNNNSLQQVRMCVTTNVSNCSSNNVNDYNIVNDLDSDDDDDDNVGKFHSLFANAQ